MHEFKPIVLTFLWWLNFIRDVRNNQVNLHDNDDEGYIAPQTLVLLGVRDATYFQQEGAALRTFQFLFKSCNNSTIKVGLRLASTGCAI